jgi:hypothetical protein
MAGRKNYIVATPDGEGHITVLKGGKRPQFATWAHKDGEWQHVGYSYKTDKLSAEKSAKSTIGSLGWRYSVTRVLPTFV